MLNNSHRFLAQSIVKRLEELPRPGQSANSSFCHTPEDIDAEELLRQIMVVHYPKLQRGELDSLTECLGKSLCLADKVSDCDDLRFFDAFNCIYEVVQDKNQPDEGIWKQFLSCYQSILITILAECEKTSSL